MYFVKARKHLEEQDADDASEKSKRDRYQRSDSARLVLQAMPSQPPPQQQHQQRLSTDHHHDGGKGFKQITEASRGTSIGIAVGSHVDFKPEELPDGACFRPKRDLSSLQIAATGCSSGQDNTAGADKDRMEQVRSAEYIGTFSVSGSNKEAREQQMESQLQQMRNARDRRPVSLAISKSGIKVVLLENNNVFMDHSLKRIWYATCDPEYCQFSFLAREPKTSAEVQYCHAFVTKTAEQAEELISIIGEAFKSTYTEAKKQPTFHELIEQQVQQQQARFREIEQEAKNALQQKLKEIATPTPFSEKAQFRMEQRRKSEDVALVVGSDKVWAKQHVEQYGVNHALSPDRGSNNVPGKRRSEIPTRQTTQPSSPLKRNSVPPQETMLPSPVPSSPPPHSLSALAIRESVETRNINSKFKGSPVTALKNEIDKRISMTNGDDIQLSEIVEREFRKEQTRSSKEQQNIMANRPLPLPPSLSMSPQRSRQLLGVQSPLQQSQPQQSQQHLLPKQHPHPLSQQRSLDDYHLPRSSSSQVPLSSRARNEVGIVKIRDSQTRRHTRPMSEIATSSSGAAGTSVGGGCRFYEQQRQSLLNNFAASFQQQQHAEGSTAGMYIYGPAKQSQESQSGVDQRLNSPQQDRGRNLTRRAAGRTGETRNGGEGYDPHSSDAIRPMKSSQSHLRQNHIQAPQAKLDQGQKLPVSGSRPSSTSGSAQSDAVVPRYQNDSPFQNDQPEKGSKQHAGLEALMCLDRSHIHDEALRNTPWYQAGLPRECALDILQQEEVGSFIVRDSSTHPGCYALSVRVPKYDNASGISHYLILRTHRGVKLKGLDKEWSTLTALVTHHTVMREMLPCTLRLPKVKGQGRLSSSPQNRGSDGGSSKEDVNRLDSDDNYSRLSDISDLVGKMKM